MRGFDHRRDGLFSYVRPESRIPKTHPLRVIRKLADEALKSLERSVRRALLRERPSLDTRLSSCCARCCCKPSTPSVPSAS